MYGRIRPAIDVGQTPTGTAPLQPIADQAAKTTRVTRRPRSLKAKEDGKFQLRQVAPVVKSSVLELESSVVELEFFSSCSTSCNWLA